MKIEKSDSFYQKTARKITFMDILIEMNKFIEKALKLRSWVKVGHHIPGRIRLKYKLGLLAHFTSYSVDDIEEVLQKIPAFKQYKINYATGSVVIEYDAEQVPPHLIEELFSDSDESARQACNLISERLDLDGAYYE